MRILMIEDSADVTESISLCLQLRWADAHITRVSEGGKGLESFQSEEFDIQPVDHIHDFCPICFYLFHITCHQELALIIYLM